MKNREWYIEFFDDPSDDKELYKRYVSGEKFAGLGFDAEVIRVIEYDEYKRALDVIFQLEVTLAEIAPSWLPENIRKQRREALSIVRDFKK